MKHYCITYVSYNGAPRKQYRCSAKNEKDARKQCQKACDITDNKIIKIVEEQSCETYEDGCEEWAGCPCIYYKESK